MQKQVCQISHLLLSNDFKMKKCYVHLLFSEISLSACYDIMFLISRKTRSDWVTVRYSTFEWYCSDALITHSLHNLFFLFFISFQHGCKKCGRLFCASCTSHSVILPEHGTKKMKVCDQCYKNTKRWNLFTFYLISSGHCLQLYYILCITLAPVKNFSS